MSGSNTARSFYGYELNEELNRMRGETAKRGNLAEQKARGGTVNWRRDWSTLGLGRRTAEGCVKYKQLISANCGVAMWTLGCAYRAAQGRCRAPRNVVNGLALSEGFATDTAGAMSRNAPSPVRMTVRRAIPGIIGWSGLRRFWSPPVRMRGPW
ncbi:hypothetical protein EVAR_89976_1 [Eumeta japonica]|uniref:Uncharacterized protein n=1 Tax=Eumeta variegata TaxID=151549 RepID=A0A4C2ACR6_EUMVA|nr:hypothetical protein EVAR_89976_1 [Eumeta japonica]